MYRLGLRRFLGVYELRLALPEGDCWETKAAEFLANRALTWGIGRRSLAAQLKLCPTQTGRKLSCNFEIYRSFAEFRLASQNGDAQDEHPTREGVRDELVFCK